MYIEMVVMFRERLQEGLPDIEPGSWEQLAVDWRDCSKRNPERWVKAKLTWRSENPCKYYWRAKVKVPNYSRNGPKRSDIRQDSVTIILRNQSVSTTIYNDGNAKKKKKKTNKLLLYDVYLRDIGNHGSPLLSIFCSSQWVLNFCYFFQVLLCISFLHFGVMILWRW